MYPEILDFFPYIIYINTFTFFMFNSKDSMSSPRGFKEKVFPYLNIALPLFLAFYPFTRITIFLIIKILIFCFLIYCLFNIKYILI